MIFRITMKDPDGVYDSIHDAAEKSVSAIPTLDADEKEDLIEARNEKLRDICGKWFEYGEYLEVEVDTDKGTCIVVPKK